MIEHAMRLDPAWSKQYLHFLGTAYLLAGKYETAAALLRQRILFVPETDFSRAILASALGHLGQVEEAHMIWDELKKNKSEILIQRAFRPATLPAGGCRKGCRGSRESRIAELTAEVALHFRALEKTSGVYPFFLPFAVLQFDRCWDRSRHYRHGDNCSMTARRL